jgi:2-oxoglutarate ferredoxin oxidoreductase subunit alpha
VIPEINTGQLARLIRAEFLIDPYQINRVRTLPFRAGDLETEILEIMGES